MKTQEELTALKDELETLNKKISELNDDELVEVTGGSFDDYWENIKKMGDKVKKDVPNPPVTPITPLTQPK